MFTILQPVATSLQLNLIATHCNIYDCERLRVRGASIFLSTDVPVLLSQLNPSCEPFKIDVIPVRAVLLRTVLLRRCDRLRSSFN